MRARRGFSLIELVLVVMIIGVIGAIAIPRISRGAEGASINAFVKEINALALVIEQYQLETNKPISDSSTGIFPSELKGYLHENAWAGETPLGGEWDIERNDNGVGLAIGIHYQRGGDETERLRQADAILDDGNLKTGVFRKLGANRYYLVLEEARSAGVNNVEINGGVQPIVPVVN